MSFEIFAQLADAITNLEIRIDGIAASIAEEQHLTLSRASLSHGMMPNGDRVPLEDQQRALDMDVDSFRNIGRLNGRLFISQRLLANLKRSKLRQGLLIVAKNHPDLNEDVLSTILNQQSK